MINHSNIYKISFVLLVLLVGLDFYKGISFYWYILPIAIVLIALVFGSFIMSFDFYLNSITRLSTINNNKVALTFDDGPHPEYTLRVLDLLKKYNAKATFFCVGKQLEKNPEIARHIIEQGHAIGNHSYAHKRFIDFGSKRKWLSEIHKTDKVIEKFTHNEPKLFRPPYGVTTPNLAKALKETNHKVIGWNIRSFDTVTKNPDLVLDRIYKRVKPGSIILLHDSHNRITYILEHLLQFLEKNDYQSVDIETMLNGN